ncbi:MAG: nitroreductase family protein [Bryobacteraceae bacterium]
MDAITALKTRHSVRSFEKRAVPKEVLEEIVDCGRLAATAINIQPWEFVVVTEPAMLRKVADATDYGKFIAGAAACIAVITQTTKYYLEDGSAASENMLVAANAKGVGTCWVAGDKKPYAPEICRILGAPEGYKLVSLIALGYPAENPSKSKRPLADVLHWEKY